ncbi:MAG: Na+/H+ antiporter subunit E [Propioniciclava sp.]|uniref:Na+/H+ antiporter subunit E n=1 Tax=Propioniciclava sp. TaxID=2038686 RepID=UPI0039E42412
MIEPGTRPAGALGPAEGEVRIRSRRRVQPKAIALLTVIWVVLVGEISIVTVVGGALLGTLVTLMFPLPPVMYAGRLHLWGSLRLVAHLVKDLAVASTRLAIFAFSRKAPRPGILRVNLRSDSDLYQVNVAEFASVVPGSIVVDARAKRRHLYLHVFDLPDLSERATIVRDTLALEDRVVHAFGSRAEIEELERLEAAEAEAAARGEAEEPSC